MKRKFLSLILALCMIITVVPASALAADDALPAVGEINITVKQDLSNANVKFTASLQGENQEITLSRDADNTTLTGKFSNLSVGNHTLTISADGYLPYTQTLEVMASTGTNITVYDNNDRNSFLEDGTDTKRYGVMPFGDVNHDGKIDDTDAQIVTEGINNNTVNDYDLNGDDKEDLSDLSYVIRDTQQVLASPIHTISNDVLKEEVKAEVSQNTDVEFSSSVNGYVPESIEDALFSADFEGSVGLKPKKEGPISEDNPVEITLNVSDKLDKPTEALTFSPPVNSDNKITKGTVIIEGIDTETNEDVTIEASIDGTSTVRSQSVMSKIGDAFSFMTGANETKTAEIGSDGSISIDLGRKVAIKKVSIRITGTANNGSLAEIAKVEFLDDFSERIKEPDLAIPVIDKNSITNTSGEHKALTFSWSKQNNITGYELSIVGSGVNVTKTTTATTYTFQSDDFTKLKAYAVYTLKVRSVSGDWTSDWSEPVEYEIIPTEKPPTPEYLKVTPAAGSLQVSWRDLWDTLSWSLFYREQGAASYTEIPNLTTPSYTISPLKSTVTYEVYVVAHNRIGSSGNSQVAKGSPIAATGVKLPEYKVINDETDRMKGITSINGRKDKSYTIVKKDGSTVTNTTATSEDWKAIADGDPNTYLIIPDWDSGVEYANFRGPIIQLDKKYTLDTIRIAPSESATVHISRVTIAYRDENGNLIGTTEDAADKSKRIQTSCHNSKLDSQGLRYYEIRFAEPITTDYLEIRTCGYTNDLTISELRLYNYDPLEHDVRDLFTDTSRSALKPEVEQKDIDALRTRANTIDTASGEYHPNRDTILIDLEYAEELLKHAAVMDTPVVINTNITARADGHEGTALPNSDLQPLGYVAAAGDKVIFYVSSKNQSIGTRSNLKLCITQYHPEVSGWCKEINYLNVGRNEVTIPSTTSIDKEDGGALYVYYDGNKGAQEYTVRVQGAQKIPMLNVEGKTGTERTAAIEAYVKALEIYTGIPTGDDSNIKKLHTEKHAAYDYNEGKNCIFNSTEIIMNNMMYSFPATQVWRAISDVPNPAEKLETAIEAMEQEVDLFYQWKGFNKNVTSGVDRYPTRRLNIRYHQMFTGAFMYAGGKHIGIEWDSVGGLFNVTPFNSGGTGGQYSGWGIAHEIGHVINAGAYVVTEVTNNVFSQVAQAVNKGETTANFRTDYENVYKAVVAGNTGHTGDLAVQLAMFWQLHLAYDDQRVAQLYNDVETQQKNLFYARVDSYIRNYNAASDKTKADIPKKNDVPLMLDSTKDDNFMRVCCLAADRDLLDFFRAWGFTPNAETIAYASNFDKEDRLIQYIDDDSRLYRMNGGGGAEGTTVTASITNAKNSRINGKSVDISLSNNNTDGSILGYEIRRNGKIVAFVKATESTYTDIVATENNKAFVYTVTAVDRLMNDVGTETLPEVKVCHRGDIDKSDWTASTNMSSAADTKITSDPNDPDDHVLSDKNNNPSTAERMKSAIGTVIDNQISTVYTGTTTAASAEIILDMDTSEQVTAVKYTPGGDNPIGAYEISVSQDGESWTPVKSGTFANNGNAEEVYFNKMLENGEIDPQMYTYDATFVKLVAAGQQTISLNELDVLGPTNDNVELEHIGRLSKEYVYNTETDGTQHKIPADSIVFYGTFKGDPAYNVVMLRDQADNIIEGDQVILAEVPETGYLGTTSDGAWIFWLEGNLTSKMDNVTSVQAELYRVSDAQKLTGQRLTSTSLHVDKPSSYPDIDFTSEKDKLPNQSSSPAQSSPTPELDSQPGADPQPQETPGLEASDPSNGETISAQNLVAKSSSKTLEAKAIAPESVQLTDNGKNGVSLTAAPAELSIASKVTLDIDSVPETVTVEWGNYDSSELFQTYYYDPLDSLLYLYTVARTGTLTDPVTANISAPFTDKINFEVTKLTSLNTLHDPDTVSFSDKKVTLLKDFTLPDFCLRDASCPLYKFEDTLPNEWYHDGVHFMLENSLMIGMSENEFKPDDSLTRAMVAQILYANAGRPKALQSANFSDVLPDWWYTDAINWAAEAGVVTGYDGNIFKPDEKITRQELAVMLHSAADRPKADSTLSSYPDSASVGWWAEDAMKWVTSVGIITGNRRSDGTIILDPTNTATRAQAATMIMQYLSKTA